jgi:branched-chain amino acid transport system ATP-binding protein
VSTATTESEPLLEARGLYAGYRDLAAARNINLQLHRGEIVALLGPNGAGKTTTLMTLAGALPALGGEVRWKGQKIDSPLFKRVRAGMGFISEERSVITKLSVRDNLLLGRGDAETALALFPQLRPILRRRAGLLSGGEQQMLTLARCLASKPSAVLVDELSLGLAPIAVQKLLEALREAALQTGTAVLLVEQQVQRALAVSDRWYLLRHGSIEAAGESNAAAVQQLTSSYLKAGDGSGDTLAVQ